VGLARHKFQEELSAISFQPSANSFRVTILADR
jgi:hypothetical protein